MKKSYLILISAALALVVLALAWFTLIAPRRAPPKTPVTPPPTPTESLTNDRYSAMSLYLAGPNATPEGLARIELTLIKTEIERGDGQIFTVSEESVRATIQKDTAMKIVNDLAPAGPYGKIKLHFAPTGTLVTDTGASQIVFLPRQDIEVSLNEKLPTGRTLAALIRLDLNSRLGAQNGVATFTLPDKLTAETYVLGGIFRNSRSIGSTWNLATPTLVTAVKQDLGLDITPKEGLTGTPDFVPAGSIPNPTIPAINP